MTQILDFIIITLLIVTIVYGIILSRKINVIRDSKRDLANLFSSFDQTILIAQTSVDELSSASHQAEKGLQAKIDKAALLIDDLAFLSERASVVAEKMAQGLGRSGTLASSSSDIPSPEQIRQLKQMAKNSSRANAAHKSPSLQNSEDNQQRQEILESLLTDIAKSREQKGKSSKKPDRESIQHTLQALGYKSK